VRPSLILSLTASLRGAFGASARIAPLVAALLSLGLGGCRAPLDDPDYSGHVGLVSDAGPEEEPLAGTEPYLLGTDRLALGIFYEGQSSRRFGLASERECVRSPHARPLRCYFIFTTDGALHYDQDTVADRVEGVLSDRFTLRGTPFWGGGIVWDTPTDLSAWDVLAVALKSSDPSFARVTISMQSGVDVLTAVSVEATDYGYAADGEWHVLRIPLADFEGLDRLNVRAPFLLGGTGNTEGHQLLVDEVYLLQD
jgi:hypothetical protein